MKILHCITLSSLGGAQTVVVNLANNQVVNNDVYIISSDDSISWISLDPRVKIIRIKELQRKISFLDVIVLIKLLYYRFLIRPDIVHLHSSKIGVLGRIAFPSKRTIYTVHGFDSIRLNYSCFLRLERLLQYFCRFIVGVSEYDKNNLFHERITHNIVFISNGIADTTSKEYTFDKKLFAQLDAVKAKFLKVIFCIARDAHPKRIDLFIDIAKNNPEYGFVWFGNTYPHEGNTNTFFVGPIPNAVMYLRYCDIFVLPSDFEGLPMCIIEAMSYSKPVVASNVGGISELLTGKNGFAVENTVEAFSEKIRYLLSNPSIYSNYANSARKDYLAYYTDNKMNSQYLAIYQTIENENKH